MQSTLKSSICVNGVGLHSGSQVSLALHPAPSNHGFVLHIADGPFAGRRFPVRADHVTSTLQCTAIGDHDISVSTIEHVMAALVGCGVDNAMLLVSGGEIPAEDGSALRFAEAIRRVGLRKLKAPRRFMAVRRSVSYEIEGHSVRFEPCDYLEIEAGITFGARVIGDQRLRIRMTPDNFMRQIAPARTFGFANQVEALRAAGLGQGGSLDNCVVVSDDGTQIVNPGGLRFDDEFVRHKILDALGDLALLGAPLKGRYIADRPSHRVNHLATKALIADATAWQWMSVSAPETRERDDLSVSSWVAASA
jgi:UDP-3-O-[3-hydroxymyristoyl] N-acetylglucosamine deacetylase